MISSEKEANVILHMTQFEQVAFTRAAQDITTLCTPLNIAIFDTDGTKVKTVAQKEGDSSYGTFSPKDGYGCVASKQTEVRPVPADFVSGTAFDIYTLPHTEENGGEYQPSVLTKLTVTALDSNDNTIKERTFENVPVTRNQVTRYTGSFFGSGGGGSTSDGSFRLTADPEWDSLNSYTF